MKTFKRFAFSIIDIIAMIMFAIVALTVPEDFAQLHGAWWAGFSFTIIAFIAVAIIALFLRLDKFTIFNTLTLSYIVLGIYVGVALVMNIVIMCLNPEKLKTTMILNVLWVCVFVAACVVASVAFSHMKNDAKHVETKLRSLRTTAVKVGALSYLSDDNDIKTAIANLKEAVTYSDPMGIEETQEIEAQLDAQLDVIKEVITAGADKDNVMKAVAEADQMLKTRNELLKASK